MSEGKPSIWRSEDEFKDTEIGRIPKEWGSMFGSGVVWPGLSTRMTRILRIYADYFNAEVMSAGGMKLEGGWE